MDYKMKNLVPSVCVCVCVVSGVKPSETDCIGISSDFCCSFNWCLSAAIYTHTRRVFALQWSSFWTCLLGWSDRRVLKLLKIMLAS